MASIGILAAPAASAAAHPADSGSAATFDREATAYQNQMIEGALARVPGGTRVSADEATWPDGLIVVAAVSPTATVPSAAGISNGVKVPFNPDATCPTYDFCGYTGPDATGTAKEYPGGSGFQPWGVTGTGMKSWTNLTIYRSWREQFQNSGNELCIDPFGNGNWSESNYSGPDLNDYWELMSGNADNCS
jgi:hypothetical protein